MSFLSKVFKATLPPIPVPESFASKSSPDFSFDAAGLTFQAHSLIPGVTFVGIGWHRPMSMVPEPSAGILLAVGIVAIAAANVLKRKTKC